METIANYLIQSGLCLLLFYLFYLLVLRSFPQLRYNRLYLLLAPVVSLFIPLLQLPLPFPQDLALVPALPVIQLQEVTVTPSHPQAAASINTIPVEFILLVLYVAAGLGLLARLGLQLLRLRKLINTTTPLAMQASEATVLQTSNEYTSFAFLHYVFLSPQNHLTEKERQQVLAHELAHVRLGHTYDVLYYEVLTAILWFNPLVWLLKAELRDVHEYQADAQVLAAFQPQEYTSLLAKEALHQSGMLIGSHFYKPQVFKRLHMLQKYGQRASLFRPLLVLPLLLLMLFIFSSRAVTADITASLAAKPERITTTDTPIATVSEEKAALLLPPPIESKATERAPAQESLSKKQTPPAPKAEDEVLLPLSDPDAEKPFIYVEQFPRFKGGEGEMMKFLGQNMRYPKSAQDAGIEGLVVASFVVEKDGTLSDITLIKGLQEDADREALRVIEAMSGQWEPGLQNGKIVRVRYTIPIRFKMK
ncbi:TonB family protein [Pontibacter ruber]|uniref:TonB family protein n=1 Tax=Pontibacter ruber TaxID=1343895 RepID=A0ABW5CXG3_9BACT|nr:M56 family metallopeptidase [Pontibacter ruber]